MGGNRHSFREAPGTSLSDRLRQQQENAKRRSELLAARSTQSKPKGFEAEDPANENSRIATIANARLSALGSVPLRPIGEDPQPLSEVYNEILRAAIEAAERGEPIVLMTWPARDICLSAVTSLLALADVAVAPETMIDGYGGKVKSFERPKGFKALIYPYARTTHELARDIQVDRKYLHRTHLDHLARHTVANDDARSLKDYHQILSRVSTLSGKGRDGTVRPEFEHPTLDEILPHGGCDGIVHPNGSLLWRTASRTDLKEHNTVSKYANDGNQAEYFLYGLKRGDELSIRKIRGGLNLIFFDLTRTGRGRLGEEWVERATRIYKTMRKMFPGTGFVAITEDPWTFDKARFDIFSEMNDLRGRKAPPAKSKTITALSSLVFKPSDESVTWSGVQTVHAKGFNGPGRNVTDDLRAVRHRVRRGGDPTGLAAINEIIATLRRTSCLPGSFPAFNQYLFDEHGQAVAADVIENYRISQQVQILRQPSQRAFVVGGSELAASLQEASTVMSAFNRTTPMSTMLETAIRRILNSSSKTLFMFRKQTLAEFAVDYLGRTIPDLQAKLDNEMIVFSGPGGLSDIAGLAPSERNKFKRIFVVSPPRDGVLSFFARPWLPREVIILADGDTLKYSSRDAWRLAEQIREPEIASRLRLFAEVADKDVTGLGMAPIKLTETPDLPEEVHFPSESVINLVGAYNKSDGELIELTMEGGQTIIARPGSALVRLDTSRSIQTFRKIEAKDAHERDNICVISSSFVDRARLLLSIQANASEAIRDYHEDVSERFAKLRGLHESDKIRTLIEKMGDANLQIATVRRWVHLEKQLQARLEDVVTQAPRQPETFAKFTAALGIPTNLANRFWHWGVRAQRSFRMKAGMEFHDAYLNILTDPDASLAFAGDAKRADEIARLIRLAEEFVSPVRSTRRFKP
ncbi:hypothetical protein HJA85_07960 [Rhizobium bangladeshense]|uniref:hypothetical protein n=1 Tax=Rhizobium bangladeshense TaxID=1138189 RepID=UPI001C834116|nr:hypothetical protein [Rhizobium bangladeshense]MBX4866902.1 hypothetical protein [Rhizobium bangladeshense]